MNFKKYSEIENHYRQKYIAILKEYGYDKVPWIATEKVHGANFSFWTDGNEVRVASRTQFVDGTFYHCQGVIDSYAENIKFMKNDQFPNAKEIAVYGELFGPGIQKGVFYGPDKDFMAFDLQVDGVVIPPIKSKVHFVYYDIPQVPYVGLYADLDEALEENNVFNSKVWDALITHHRIHGQDACEYEEGENSAEGIVLQPAEGALYTGNGSRVIIKSKNPKFTEKNKRKDRDSKEYVPNPFVPVVEQYVNRNRLDAVLSKFVGEPTPKDFGKIIGLMGADVVKDMIKDEDLPEDYKKQDKYKLAGKAVSKVVADFLKVELLPEL